ncbi:BURP domain-containing protein 9-like isoform X2 [Mercurialis annua]|uniref:BURP domain-containing protein 9-like isoform X2 n=1 Tax=Mercurialis annua TaxID=3986 RepID=UPI00215DDA6E|nr:BURP domain-containing protein 9-like isoform X2 [Mercurialis annua]
MNLMASMEFLILPLFAVFCMILGGSNASVPSEEYWHSKLPNTPIPAELQKLIQPAELGGKFSFWDMGFNNDQSLLQAMDDKRSKYGKRYDASFSESVDDKRSKYGKRYDAAFEEGTNDKREKYGKRYDAAFEEGTNDKREKYGKRYDAAFEEGTNDKREKYGKRYDAAFEEGTNDKREKYGKRYDAAFEEGTNDKREKYGKRYDAAFEEGTNDKREKYGKRYDAAFEEGTNDKREKYGKRYDAAFEEGTNDKREKYGKRYDAAFEEGTNDKREKYGKRYDAAFEEGTNDKREKYGKRYDAAFEEGTNDKREKYGKRYDAAFEEGTNDKREKYGKRYDAAFEEGTNDRREKYGKRYKIGFKKHALPNSTVFFLQKDLQVGQKMKLHITKSSNKAKFLPRQDSESMPFSSKILPQILQKFSVKPDSMQAKIIKQTIDDCESSAIKGEERYCPKSLESLLDFAIPVVGNKTQVLYNEVERPSRIQEYTIMGVKMVGENQVVCHKQKYPYAVYYCHSVSATKVYQAPLVGADGLKAKAVAICHSDTSNWNPQHLAFLMLNVKPGEATICHFIRSDTIVWTSNK